MLKIVKNRQKSSKIVKNRQKSQFCNLENGVLKILVDLWWTKPGKIECLVLFILVHNGQIQLNRLVTCKLDVWFWKNIDSLTKDDD